MIQASGLHGVALRVFSGLLLITIVVGSLFAGSPYFEALIGVCGLLAAWEWARLCAGKQFGRFSVILSLAVAVAVLAMVWGRWDMAMIAVGLGAVVSVMIGVLSTQRTAGVWVAGGHFYLGLPLIALIWLYKDSQVGAFGIIFLLLLVWGTDTGAYVVGRLVGGPKLAPKISPQKTWAGLAGGIIVAAVVAVILTSVFALEPLLGWRPAAIFAGVVAVVSQCGDLFESWVKRRYGVKDMSGILPGHGGILDRVDGLVAAVVFVAAMRLMY